MERPSQPTDVAREAIKRLATGKRPPTPENFRRAYYEVMGKEEARAPWAEAIKLLLKEWESYQVGLTQSKKRDMLDRVLINFAHDPVELANKLLGLAKTWSSSGHSGTAVEGELAEAPADAPPREAAESSRLSSDTNSGVEMTGAAITDATAPNIKQLGQSLTRYLDAMGGGCQVRWPDLAKRLQTLSMGIERAEWTLDEQHVTDLASIWREMLVRADNDGEYIVSLKRLLTLLFENISELVSDDRWLSGQLSTVQVILSGELSPYALSSAEASLKEVVHKQQALKTSLIEAKEKLRHLISTFVNRVGEISTSTGDFQTRIQGYSERISKADDISQLSEVIDSLSTDMTDMRDQMQRTHEELVQARGHVEAAEGKIQSLEQELSAVSSLVREDQLTGALNRRGMEEAFEKEEARSDRMHAPLSVGLLDIDHFKKLNDSLGHQAGDQALIHLTRIIHKMLRPTDTLARYGGEEFLLIFPNTDVVEAQHAMQRIQRELTKEYFLHDNQRVLITFSAGVAQHVDGEPRDQFIKRADAAMYRAKGAGRNRVECG